MSTVLKLQELQGLCRSYLSREQSDETETSLEKLNFEVKQYKLSPISDEPAGYLGRHNFLTVELAFKQNSIDLQTISFFTKAAPHDIASRMQYLDEFGVFKKEIAVYSKVLPELQHSLGVVAPNCYYAHDNLLVFENLTEQGYKMAAGRDGLFNYEHLHCAIKTLATMHAGSIVYEARTNQSIPQQFPVAVAENAYPLHASDEQVRVQNFNNAIAVFKVMVSTMPKYKANLARILKALPQRMFAIFELAQPSTKYQNVFLHGDLWANNVMFQYGKYGETPIQCRFVDFQLSRYAPPMLDLVTLITIPTTRAYRAQHFLDLVDDYYRFMEEFLKSKQLNIADYLPKQQFYAAVEEYRICGLVESCLYSHLTMLPLAATQMLTQSADGFSDFFDRKRVEICMFAYENDDLYRARMNDMLEDLVDSFVLQQ